MKGLCILGATGSIGVSTLDVVRRHADKYKVVALTANTNVYALLNQCMEFKPEYVVLADAAKGIEFKTQIAGTAIADITVLVGAEALTTVATLESVCTVMAAIVGAAGLLPTLAAAQAGKTVLLANKESLVMSGDIFMQAIKDSGAILLPIDSEHNAIFQCMPANYAIGHKASNVKHILLTASGGPFRTTPLKKLADVTVEQAIAHPKWDMGRKISVDSATMMNKGLELIEACLLFDIQVEQIQVVIHPQSIIHSMVAYVDGSVLAQMGNPDMRIPIAHAMAWPDRFDSGATPLDIFAVKKMDFEATDLQRFPCLRLAMEAISAGGIMPTVLNAANEFAVEAFLNEQIRFTDIPLVIENSMEKFSPIQADSLEHILKIDQQARQQADQVIATIIA